MFWSSPPAFVVGVAVGVAVIVAVAVGVVVAVAVAVAVAVDVGVAVFVVATSPMVIWPLLVLGVRLMVLVSTNCDEVSDNVLVPFPIAWNVRIARGPFPVAPTAEPVLAQAKRIWPLLIWATGGQMTSRPVELRKLAGVTPLSWSTAAS